MRTIRKARLVRVFLLFNPKELRAIRRIALFLSVLSLSVGGFVAPATAQKFVHHPECSNQKCAHHADKLYAKLHRPKLVITRFDLCIANKETGEPGSLNPRYIRPWLNEGTYNGAFQEEHDKWVKGGGLKYTNEPFEASWHNQVRVFHRHLRQGEMTYGNWPTLAGCEQYR